MVSLFPKMLFLLLLLLMFLSPVRTQDTPKDVVYATLRYGGCKGNKPLGNDVLSEDFNEILAPTILILVMVDRKTKIIEYVQPLEFKFDETHGSFMLHPVVGFKIDSNNKLFPKPADKDLEVVIHVQTAGNDKMDGVDHQIYYGFNPAFAIFDQTKEPFKQLTTEAFRITELKFDYVRNGANHTFYQIKDKQNGCENMDSLAWILNHGLYRVQRNDRTGGPQFVSLYYWPQVGKLYT